MSVESPSSRPAVSAATPHSFVMSPRAQYMALLAAFLGWMFDGLEMGLFPLVARPALLDLMGPGSTEGAWMGWITAGFLVGAAAGGLLFGWLGDRVGRVKAMVWSVLTYAIFSGLCGFAQAPWQLAVLRFLAALGMGGEWSLGVALVMEIWPSKSRPMLAGLIGAASNVGFLLIALIGLSIAQLIGPGNSSWRMLMFVGATPALLTFFVRIFVPESERWQHAAARAPAARIGEIFAPGILKTTLLGTGLGGMALIGTWASIQWVTPWSHRMAQGTEYADTAASYTQISLAIGAIVGTLLAAYCAEWFSRRLSYFVLCLLSLAVCGVLFRTQTEFGLGFLLVAGLAGCVTASFYGWLPLYLPELFPTRIRATGQGFAFNFGRVLAAIGALQSGWLLDRFDRDYARMGSIMSLVYIVGLVLIWFCPETKGRPLPD